MVDIHIDDSEVRQFASDLGEVARTAGRYIRSAVEKSAREVKDQWREDAEGQLGTRRFPKSIDYDVTTLQAFGVSVIEAEIGPNKSTQGRQAALGNLIEFGGKTDGGLLSRRGIGEAALERVEGDFEYGLSKALEDAENAAAVDSSLTGQAGAVIRGSYR